MYQEFSCKFGVPISQFYDLFPDTKRSAYGCFRDEHFICSRWIN
jgi:hypothetical protein